MADRENHYECAFEEFLRHRRVAYVAVDETRRSLMGNGSLKSLDFLVSVPGGGAWLVDVKGRKFPSGGQQFWRNWSTNDDLESLSGWEGVFGPGFRGLFVFAYHVVGDMAPVPPEQLFRYRDAWYGFIAVPLREYAAHARPISPRWGTVALPTDTFRRLAEPFQAFL